MGLENSEPTGNIEGIDADALLAGIEDGGGNTEIPMSQPEPVEAAAPTVSELEFEWNGKPIKAPFTDPRVKQWASQGYDYSQRMSEFTQAKTAWEAERQALEAKLAPYREIDQYAQKNPQWWETVEGAWKSRGQPQSGTEPGTQPFQLPPEVKAEIDSLKQFKTEFETEKAAKAQEAEDTKLVQEIQSIRKDYSNLDWNTPDQSGQTLEQRVLKHAMDNGINNFRAAFRDYNHDALIKLHEHRGLENANKELQKRTKLGLLGESSAPKKGLASAEGVKHKSYADLEREALSELGIA